MSKPSEENGSGENLRSQYLTSVRSIERALNILECFSREKPLLTLSEISQQLDLYPSTTLRVLTTLENRGYIRRDKQTLQYSLGYKLVNLGSISMASENLRDKVHPYLLQLRDRFNETTGLYVLTDNYRICIDSVPSTHSLHRSIEVGRQMRLTRGASGKLILSYLPEERIESILKSDPFVTIQQLRMVREQGYAISFSENEKGLVSIATPIFNADRQILGAIFISGPTSRMNDNLISEITNYMKELSGLISRECGY